MDFGKAMGVENSSGQATKWNLEPGCPESGNEAFLGDLDIVGFLDFP